MADEDTADAAGQLVAQVRTEIEALDRELAEIEMLVGQARTEATRHELKRATATEKLAHPDGTQTLVELAEGYGTLVVLTRRAVLMDAQVDVLDGKHKALARHRASLTGLIERLEGVPVPGVAVAGGTPDPGADGLHEDEALPPPLSRLVLSAQEDLRREIARAMHDGPAQSLTNIVLQAQIVDRLVDRDIALAKGEVRLLVQMVQQTLDATKNFIFDVRPMVLDDLGLVPTLRRAARDRGRRAHVPVEFESLGVDRRLPMDVESAVFRILDDALAAYLHQKPEQVLLRIDWGDELDVHLTAHRAPAVSGNEPLPDVPTGEMPDALRAMIQERHDARDAAVAAAEQAAIVVLPPHAQRNVLERAGSIGAKVEITAGGGELHLTVALPPAAEESREPA
jgi:two-component system, NarL family, sensor histidine kinase DegS